MSWRRSNVGVNVTSNIDDVIDSIDDVKDDIRYEMRKRVNRAMEMCAQRARVYVQKDSDYTGSLYQSIKTDNKGSGFIGTRDRELDFRVYTDARIAPHAALVEFGSGDRGERGDEWKNSESAKPPENYPSGFPYDAPDPMYDDEVPSNLDDFPEFAELVSVIQEWMRNKPVEPEGGRTIFESSVLIAQAIVEDGRYQHPFMRPAWYDTELRVKKAATNALRNATR